MCARMHAHRKIVFYSFQVSSTILTQAMHIQHQNIGKLYSGLGQGRKIHYCSNYPLSESLRKVEG